ncbi:MAG: tryptophan-rich sensory protein [Bacteroidaceae bacterium]|nr:tryptophan-rich sensory protein [Bacteroidaceae bacterium]MBR3855540.1 tryptophan-rich sensory protein [Bacteroidaceae bacterium]
MNRTVSVVLWVGVSLLAGYLSSLFQSLSSAEWYDALQRSPFTPDDWVFPVAWTLLYILMGVAAGLLWRVRSIFTRLLNVIFVVQLALNFFWTFFFFYMQSPLLAFVDILFLDIAVLLFFAGAFVVYRPSAWLFVPYLLWLVFATYLNWYIVAYN